jgi:phage terminase small subunit
VAGVPGQASGGHNRKSEAQHRLDGTFRSDRHAPQAVVMPMRGKRKAPRAPAGLSEASQRVWRQVHEQYDVSSAPSLELLESALRSRDRAEQARRVLDKDGLLIGEGTRPHPLIAVERDSRAAFVNVMRTLGFPSEDR